MLLCRLLTFACTTSWFSAPGIAADGYANVGSMPAAPAGASRDDGVIPRVPFGHPGLLACAPPGHFLALAPPGPGGGLRGSFATETGQDACTAGVRF
jgi:hypothetical protein